VSPKPRSSFNKEGAATSQSEAHLSRSSFLSTWPDKFSIDRSASVVVIGRDIKPASSNKIMKKDLQSVVGLDGLKNWVEERRKEIEVQEEVVSSFSLPRRL